MFWTLYSSYTVLISNNFFSVSFSILFIYVDGYNHKGFEHYFSQTFIPAKPLISTITNSHRSKIHMRVHAHYVNKADRVKSVCMLVC